MRTIPDIANQLTLLDEVISTEFIPAITGGNTCSSIERKLLSLPTKLGGLGIPMFVDSSIIEYNNSIVVSENLTNNIINQV